MENSESTRIDKWLWAVRLFKTRNLATTACRQGKVRIAGQKVKPSRIAVPDDRLDVEADHLTRRVRIVALPASRVGAKLVANFLEDLTPAEDIERARRIREEHRLNRVANHGDGRPTKRQRREMESFLDQVRQTSEAEHREQNQD